MYWNILFGYSNTLVGDRPKPRPGRLRFWRTRLAAWVGRPKENAQSALETRADFFKGIDIFSGGAYNNSKE